jgi:hypothetical protein
VEGAVKMKALALIFSLLLLPAIKAADPKPLYRAHAHNDYEHARPLWDALEHGFTSIEADIHLVNGKLLVGHDLKDVSREKTLETLYLDPLSKLAHEHGGRIYPHWPSVILLIDIKTEAESTYRALSHVFEKYSSILTRFADDSIHTNAITAIITGNRPRKLMLEQKLRYAAYDGRLADLETSASPAFIPLVSDSWLQHFQWNGTAPFPADERARLKDIVAKTHAQKRALRLWAAPDNEAARNELYSAGVDFLNTDDLAGLEKFLRAKEIR